MISVILPLYNKALYVEKAIQSVFAQTYTDWELIIIDDGSTDNSVSVVEAMLHDGSLKNVHVIKQSNVGVSTTRNRGVALAQGEYVCFLDADDWWDEHFLTEISKALEDYPEAGIIGTNYWYVKNNRSRVSVKDMTMGYVNYINAYAHQMQVGGGMPLWTGAVCVRKDVLETIGGFNPRLRLGEDFDLWIRIAHKYKVAFVDKPLAFYNQDVDVSNRATQHLHDPSRTELSRYDAYLELYDNASEVRALIDKKRIVGWYPYYLSDQYRELAKKELAKVDWTCQPKSVLKTYQTPIWQLKMYDRFMTFASKIKQFILSH